MSEHQETQIHKKTKNELGINGFDNQCSNHFDPRIVSINYKCFKDQFEIILMTFDPSIILMMFEMILKLLRRAAAPRSGAVQGFTWRSHANTAKTEPGDLRVGDP